MRVFISADLEGISGIVHARDEEQFEAGLWMTRDVNAAVEGAFSGGASRVVVRDSHGSARNMRPELLDARAELCRGWGVDNTMVEGVEDGFDVLLLVGYHACWGTQDGVISHTWTGYVRGVRLGETEVGEIGLAAATAGAAGVPLGLVTGCDRAAHEAEALIPGVHTAIVKYGITRTGARTLPFAEAHARIRDAARQAVEGPLPAPFQPEFPLEAEIRLRDKEMAAAASRIPQVRRCTDLSVAMDCQGIRDLLDFFYCTTRIASTTL